MRAWSVVLVFVMQGSLAAATGQARAQPAKPAAQTPANPAAEPLVPPPTSTAEPPRADAFTYQSEGRRDPFLSLLGTGTALSGASKGEGAAGLSVADLSVRGVIQSRDGLIAMVQGPDKKTYIVRRGDKFADGTIRNVTPEGLVIVQEVNDPLSLVKQREIRKLLRSLEDAKE